MSIKATERVCLVGSTGSGKSYLARQLLKGTPRLIVCNPKGDPDMPRQWGLVEWKRGFDLLRKGKPARVHVPPLDDDDEWEAYLNQMFTLRGVIIFIDEIFGVGPAHGSRALRKLYTQGRGLGIGVWGCTQRPVGIPKYCITEAEWVITFRLRDLDDRDEIGKKIGVRPLPRVGKHQFILFNDEMESPQLCIWRAGKVDILKTF